MMKPLILSIVSVLLIIASGCNTTDSDSSEEILQFTLTSTQTLKYQTGVSGDEEQVLITQQAEHFEISDIIRDESTNYEAVYRYKPEAGFIGTDRVELKLARGSDGASPNDDIRYVTLEFTVE